MRPDILKWTEEYQSHAASNPWFFVVQSAEIKPGDGIRITMFPDVDARIKLGTMIEPKSDDDIQVPRVIVDEVITERNSHELREVLTVIQKTQGLCFEDGLLMIVHLFFWLVDWDRNKRGEPSLLSGRTFRDEPDDLRNDHDRLMNVLRYYSMTSVDKLLRLWRDNQSLLIGGLVRPCPGKPGLPTYMYFPPHWLSPEDLRKLDGDEAEVPQVPVLVDADVVSMVPAMVDLLKARADFEQRAPAEPPGRFVNAEQGTPRKHGYMFCRVGDYWKIVYEGEETLLKDCKGVRYLAFLVQNPDRPFLALHLVMHDSGQLPEPDPTYALMSAAELSDHGLDSIGFAEADLENARTSVSHAIEAVLKRLKESNPTCYAHFRASYTSGSEVSYRPNGPIHWQF